MVRARTFGVLGLAALGALGALGAACGDDDDDAGATAGAAGTSSAGAAGTGGQAGQASGGKAGQGGASGTAGKGGASGTAGKAGGAGTSGAGTSGAGGSAGAGMSGSSGQGAGGSSGAAGGGAGSSTGGSAGEGGSAGSGPTQPYALYLAGGQDLRRVSSLDGQTWGHDVYVASNGLDNAFACFAYGKGLAVAAGNSGVYTTKDGVTWTPTSSDPGKEGMHVCAGGFHGKQFVIVSGDRTYRSTDGLTWEKAQDSATAATHWSGLVYGNGRYVAFGDSNSAGCHRKVSEDGITWHDYFTEDAGVGLRSAVHVDGQFVAVGRAGRHATSKDGVTWENDSSEGKDFDGDLESIAYGASVYVAMGCCGAATSPDGLKWTKAKGGVNGHVAFANGLFVGAGWYADIAVSPDGTNWKKVYDGKVPNQFDSTKDAPWFTAIGAGMISP